jgi:hypothetical protein
LGRDRKDGRGQENSKHRKKQKIRQEEIDGENKNRKEKRTNERGKDNKKRKIKNEKKKKKGHSGGGRKIVKKGNCRK